MEPGCTSRDKEEFHVDDFSGQATPSTVSNGSKQRPPNPRPEADGA